MSINLPPKVRQVIYVVTAIATPLVAYLGTEGKLDTFYVGLYSVIVTAVSGLAALNVTTKDDEIFHS